MGITEIILICFLHFFQAQFLKIRKVNPGAITPSFATSNSAGLDLHCVEPFTLASGTIESIDTGIQIELPQGYYAQIMNRSSLAKLQVSILAGVIDNDYRGNVYVMMYNFGEEPVHFRRNAKIAQFLCLPFLAPAIVEVSNLSETERGANGFGSSGR